MNLFSESGCASDVISGVAILRHVIHCSGYSLAERNMDCLVTNRRSGPVSGKFNDWDRVCIGDPANGLLGRIPMTLEIAREFHADHIIWSTGATWAHGQSEARFMMVSAIEYASTHNMNVKWLQDISILEEESTNTATSLHSALQFITTWTQQGENDMMIHLVTSNNHAPRVAKDAAIAFAAHSWLLFSVVPAGTSYGLAAPPDVDVFDLGMPKQQPTQPSAQ